MRKLLPFVILVSFAALIGCHGTVSEIVKDVKDVADAIDDAMPSPRPTAKTPTCDNRNGVDCDCYQGCIECGEEPADIFVPCPRPTVHPTPSASSSPTEAPTGSPAPTATSEPGTPTPARMVVPTLDGVTGTEDIVGEGKVELAQRYLVKVPADVADEPKAEGVSLVQVGAKTCDKDHWRDPLGHKTVMWWVCGGSVRYGQEPRPFDAFAGFDIHVTQGNVDVKYPCWRDDPFNACIRGRGEVTICAPDRVYTCRDPRDLEDKSKRETCPSGRLPLPVAVFCRTRKVHTAADTK